MAVQVSVSERDAALIRAVLSGDVCAFAVLYDHYAALVRAMCFDTTGNLAVAQDLAQEVFIRAYERLPGLREPRCFARWITQTTRRVCCEWRRGRARDRHRYMGLAPVEAQNIARPAQPPEIIGLLHKAIAQLPERERLALHAFYLASRPIEEARAALGLSRSGMYLLLSRARKRLARRLRIHWEERP